MAVMAVMAVMAATDALSEVIKQGPLFGVLVFVLIYFYNALGKKEKDIKELNKEMRQSDKDNLDILGKLTTTLDSLVEKENTNTEKIITELRNLRDNIINNTKHNE